MDPLVYRIAPAVAAFNITALIWLVSELRIMIRNRGGTGENLDMGSRVWVVALIGMGLGAAVALAWQGSGPLAGWWPVAVGLLIALSGIALRQWSVATLGAFFTTAVEVQAHHRIIDTGPYTRLRHPSYSGALLTGVGMALALGSWLGCIVAAALALAGIVQRILVEERALASRLGPAWTAFARHRHRLIPLVW
jgi:protein-S-isoprenylcysteine O-methyltransferase